MQNESDPPPSRPSAFDSGRLHCTLACTAPSALLAPTRAMPKVFGESDVQLLLQCLRKHVACCIPQSVPPFAFGTYANRLDQPHITGLLEIKALLHAVLSAVPGDIIKQIALRDAAKLLLEGLIFPRAGRISVARYPTGSRPMECSHGHRDQRQPLAIPPGVPRNRARQRNPGTAAIVWAAPG